MEAMRQSWSDDRLDHLNYRVEEGFRLGNEKSDRVETSVSDRRAEMNHRFDRSDDHVDLIDIRIRESFDRLEDRFDRLQQGIMVVGGGLVCSLIATLGGLFVSLN